MPKQNVVPVFYVIHLSHNNSITDMNQSVLADIRLFLGLLKMIAKNISRENKCTRNWPVKLQSLWNFSMSFILTKDSLHILKHCIYCIYLTHEYSHILPERFFEPTTIHRTQFFVQKFNFVIKDGRMQLSNIQANEYLV